MVGPQSAYNVRLKIVNSKIKRHLRYKGIRYQSKNRGKRSGYVHKSSEHLTTRISGNPEMGSGAMEE